MIVDWNLQLKWNAFISICLKIERYICICEYQHVQMGHLKQLLRHTAIMGRSLKAQRQFQWWLQLLANAAQFPQGKGGLQEY